MQPLVLVGLLTVGGLALAKKKARGAHEGQPVDVDRWIDPSEAKRFPDFLRFQLVAVAASRDYNAARGLVEVLRLQNFPKTANRLFNAINGNEL